MNTHCLGLGHRKPAGLCHQLARPLPRTRELVAVSGVFSLNWSLGDPNMAESARQKRITGRVMHEFKHGELKSGPGGKGGPVKNRRQAIAIALEEAGASRYESSKRNRRNLRRTEQKEAKGRTGQQEREGASHIGASGRRESTTAMGGRTAKKRTVPGRKGR